MSEREFMNILNWSMKLARIIQGTVHYLKRKDVAGHKIKKNDFQTQNAERKTLSYNLR